MRFRKYRKGDEKNIVSLFNNIFNENRTLKYWNWKFAKNPAGFDITISEHNKKIIGQYCNHFKKGWYFNKEYKFLNVVDLFAEKEFQGDFTKKALPLQKFKFPFLSINFPKNFLVPKLKNHKLVDGFIQVPIFEKKFYSFFNRSGFKIIKCNDIPKKEVDELWEKKKKELIVSVVRNSEYLKWRFFENPTKNHFFLLEKGNEIIGYLIFVKKDKTLILNDILILNKFIDKTLIRTLKNITLKFNCKKLKVLINDEKLKPFFVKYLSKVNSLGVIYEDRIKKRKNLQIYITFSDLDSF